MDYVQRQWYKAYLQNGLKNGFKRSKVPKDKRRGRSRRVPVKNCGSEDCLCGVDFTNRSSIDEDIRYLAERGELP
jgi:hypothetical protein